MLNRIDVSSGTGSHRIPRLMTQGNEDVGYHQVKTVFVERVDGGFD